MSAIALAEIDVARLVLPAGYTETPWPGYERGVNLPVQASGAAKHWETMPPPR